MPDFGIFRGFNEKLFGDKLYAGQLPTQLGLIGSENLQDLDVLAFFDRVTIAGGTLSATEKLAIDTLVRQMKTDGIWTKMKAIYPMVGASAAACAQNLKSSSFTGTFTSGWTFASTGVTPNGTSAFMNTNLTPSIELSQNSNHLSFYSRSNISTSISVEIGSQKLSPASYFYTHIYYTGNLWYSLLATNSATPVTNTNSFGFFNPIRNSSTFVRNFKNGTNLGDASMNSIALNDLSVYIGALNSNGSGSAYSSKQCAFASIGDGLTDTEASNFYTAVQAFQTTLSRQV
jgi:hypothetical protein